MEATTMLRLSTSLSEPLRENIVSAPRLPYNLRVMTRLILRFCLFRFLTFHPLLFIHQYSLVESRSLTAAHLLSLLGI